MNLLQLGMFRTGRPPGGAGEVLGKVREIEGPVGRSRRAFALRTSLFAALIVLVALPATAFGASMASVAGNRVNVNGSAGNDVITVSAAATPATSVTVEDTTGVIAGLGCVSGGANVATCTPIAPTTGFLFTTVNGLGGNDTIVTGLLGDTINGGPGDDRIHSGAGRDIVNGNSGNDVINSGRGGITAAGDFVTGGPVDASGDPAGSDTLTFEDRAGPVKTDLREGRSSVVDDDGALESAVGFRVVIGGAGSDELIGSHFADIISGGPGNNSDVICGALGNDIVDYSGKDQGVFVDLEGLPPAPGTPQTAFPNTDPDTVLVGNAGVSARVDCRPVLKEPVTQQGRPDPSDPRRDCTANDGVPGENDCVGEDVENVIGTGFDDVLIGNVPDPLYGLGARVEPSGANKLDGGNGNDLLDGLAGPDVFGGGNGFDAVSYEGRTEGVAASIDAAANDGSASDFNARNNESDQIGPDIEDLIGGDGPDVLKGDDSDNILLGGPGNDLIQGHEGSDELGGDAGYDALEGGSGGDVMGGGGEDDLLHGGLGNDSLDGGDGVDTVDYSDATVPVNVTPDDLADDGIAAEGDWVRRTVESAIGGLDDDRLTGNEGNGILQGGGGNDVLTGGLGADLLIGGVGRDTASYYGHPGAVNVNLAVGGGDGLPDEGDDITGDVEDVVGSAFDDTIAGNGELNIINGFHGNDRISGAEGDDFLAGHLGNDTLNGDVGADILDGAEGNDRLNGTAGNDTLRGFTGTDVLDGGAGADTMSGGDGIDVVTYASRSADVNVDTHGTPDDGERNENDQIRTDVESLTTGSGDDTINISDGATGVATCGGGTDDVTADAGDDIGSGCEQSRVRQAGICVPTSRAVRLSGNRVSLRMNCAFAARGTVRLQSAGRIKLGKSKRKLTLGSKSFKSKIGAVTVRVNVSKRAARVIKRRKSLRVEAVLRARRDAANAAMRTSRTKITVRTSRK
jgi:Ca2+-binding RTX toxin-like protein